MAAIAAASPIGAYQREASRLTPAAPRVPGKVISREAGLSFGPFSLRYSATDYEFDLSGASVQTSFADALDAAAASARLAETPALGQALPPNAATRRNPSYHLFPSLHGRSRSPTSGAARADTLVSLSRGAPAPGVRPWPPLPPAPRLGPISARRHA